ncbi:MAG: metallophosphoesterase [Candidatus Hydrogenedentota bacterium]
MRLSANLALAFLVAASASAQSGFYIPPHIQNIGQNGATLIWESNETEVGTVRFGPAGADSTGETTDAESSKIHRLRIGGLTPGTQYTYTIESGDDAQEATFTTAPASDQEEMTFIVVGDSRRWDNRWEETGMDKHAEQWDADLYLTMGDLVRDGHQYEQWPEHFARFSDLTKEKWFVTARGNHEGSLTRNIEDDWFAKYHELPGDGEPYAYFTWGNTHFMLISYESTGRPKDWSTSAQWLDEHLEGIDSQYTVVAQHFPVYCTGYYGNNLNRKEPGIFAKDFRDVMDKHNVTLNAAGHTHIYERHYPLRNNERNDRDGTWYVVNGGDINANFPDWWTALTDNRAENAKPTYTVYQAKKNRIIGRTFAFNRRANAIEQIDYFIIWQDESIPATRLAALGTLQGADLVSAIDDLGAMIYAPAAKHLLSLLDHNDASIRHAAAKAIGMISNGKISNDLLPYLTAKDAIVSKYSARAFEGAMPSKSEKKIINLLKNRNTHTDVRFHLIGALEFHGDRNKAATTFMSLLADDTITGEVRRRAAYSLGQVADSRDTKQLIKLFEVEESQYVTLSLATALNKATGKRNNSSDNGPIAESKPGERAQFIERWSK